MDDYPVVRRLGRCLDEADYGASAGPFTKDRIRALALGSESKSKRRAKSSLSQSLRDADSLDNSELLSFIPLLTRGRLRSCNSGLEFVGKCYQFD